MAPPLSSFVRAVLPIRSLGSPFLRFSTSIHSQILGVLESDISGSSQEVEVGKEDVPNFQTVVKSTDNVCIQGVHKDERIVLETDFDQLSDPLDTRMTAHIFKGDLQMQFDIAFKPDMVAVEDLSMRNYRDGHLKDFEKFLDIRGINLDLTKLFLDKLEETGRDIDFVKETKRTDMSFYASYSGAEARGVVEGLPTLQPARKIRESDLPEKS